MDETIIEIVESGDLEPILESIALEQEKEVTVLDAQELVDSALESAGMNWSSLKITDLQHKYGREDKTILRGGGDIDYFITDMSGEGEIRGEFDFEVNFGTHKDEGYIFDEVEVVIELFPDV